MHVKYGPSLQVHDKIKQTDHYDTDNVHNDKGNDNCICFKRLLFPGVFTLSVYIHLEKSKASPKV